MLAAVSMDRQAGSPWNSRSNVVAAFCGTESGRPKGRPVNERKFPMSNTRPDPSDAATPTVVLVHGAFAESASWNGVVADLQRRGCSVIAVANPLRGLQEDAAYLRSVLDSLSGPVVVAGHSYGGSVMSEAADGAPRRHGPRVRRQLQPGGR